MRYSRTWHENFAGRAYSPPARKPEKMVKGLDDAMPYGKHKGMRLGPLCRLEPAYVHFLVNDGRLAATAAICHEIQRGYDAEARRLTQEHGAVRAGRFLYVLNAIAPKRGPSPSCP